MMNFSDQLELGSRFLGRSVRQAQDRFVNRPYSIRLAARIFQRTLLSCIALFPLIASAEDYLPKKNLSVQEVKEASAGCLDCHIKTDSPSMHESPGVNLGCASCHGGDPTVRATSMLKGTAEYNQAKERAHVLPVDREFWKSSANPKRSYTKLLKEPAEFVRFINPGDFRVADKVCGVCHEQIVKASTTSLMTTAAMFWQGASYNNNILPNKIGFLGESYDEEGKARGIQTKSDIDPEEKKRRNILDKVLPLPQWEVIEPGDNFRIFERGGLFVNTQFAETGNPNPLDEPGKPDVLQSNRGLATGARISVPVLNIHKTRLNDPHLSLMGTNDHPGDYRSSGCTSCHVVYGNDRNVISSGPYAKYGNEGKTVTIDPTIPKDESAHPLRHSFTRAIPTSQCMVCHMHQPNMFVNSYLGFTMWDYESDAPFMWPEKQKYPTHDEMFESLSHNPEEAAARGKWSDIEFLKDVSKLNSKLKDTQFADYHGHGWNFRAIFKKDKKGRLLDENDKVISHDDPAKFKKAVHMMDIHAEKGMHCSDCHFAQDSHGDGNLYGEVAHAVEVDCKDCHGSVSGLATLRTSGPAAPEGGNDLSLLRTAFGDLRFEWREDGLYQRSGVTKDLEWRVKQVFDAINPESVDYNEKAARAKTLRLASLAQGKPDRQAQGKPDRQTQGQEDYHWGFDTSLEYKDLAHSDDKMSCFTCHSSWVTSCAGCHLPIQANWKQQSKHFDGKTTRNWASYNPQVARDEMFQLGLHGPAKGGKIVPIRSSSALVLSSKDANRQIIYAQQPPISAAGFSSQAFAPHFPHTVRTNETKTCVDCHISKDNDNNATMAQLLLLGTNFVNFMGYHAYLATGEAGLEAVQVSEWDEPQAVIGSYLHKYAYPDWHKEHLERKLELETSHTHHGVGGVTNAIQLRGEYLYTTAGSAGFRVYDVANIANKGFSERIVTSPFSPLGQDTHVSSRNATHFALPTNMPVAPDRKPLPENLEQEMHEIYHYALITDSEEGLILVNVDALADRERRNNFLKRALTWNKDGVLSGARHIQLAGHHAYILTQDKLVIIDLDTPLKPKLVATLSFNDARALAIQFRYAFLVDADGMQVVDLTNVAKPKRIASAAIKLEDARNIYLARTYAYIAGGKEGLVIVDIEKPEKPFIDQVFSDEGKIDDLNDVKIATTNASLFAYLADGRGGLKVLQLTDPERVPGFYGFSPRPKPRLIAQKKTLGPALAISKPLDRDRAVDEDGHQVSVFGRLGSRPFNKEEMRKLYLRKDGSVYRVE